MRRRLVGRGTARGLAACAVISMLALSACVWIPARSRPVAEAHRIEGWIPYWVRGEQVAREAAAAGFTDLLLFHGTVDEQGGVSIEKPEGLEQARVRAEQAGAQTWFTVTNHGKSLEGALGPGRLEAHADHLVRAFRASRCRHLDLDYESMTPAQAMQLPRLARLLDARLDASVRLSFTLQPVDTVYRPEQRPMVRELLHMPRVATVRFMMYDYAWRNSLPGALCPKPAYERLLRTWARYADKLTVCLPLYGYDWPRPNDLSLPRAETVILRNVAALPAEFFWMRAEGELAARYTRDGVPRMVAVPSLRAVNERVRLALDFGVPAVAFWHLGAAELAPVAQATRRDIRPTEVVSYKEIAGWDEWLTPFKRRVCRVMISDGTSLETLASRHGIPLNTLLRFNAQIQGDPKGQRVYLPMTREFR